MDEAKKVLKYVRKTYDNLDDDSMLMVVFTGRTESQKINIAVDIHEESSLRNDLHKGRCFVKIKSDSVDKLEAEIKSLYDSVNPGEVMKEENEEAEF
jgi:hypothetical protein